VVEAEHNLFKLKSEDVLIDLLTDSGTGALSTLQWAAMQAADEAYAGSASWLRFEAAVKELFDYKHLFPTHQGRAAEKILFGAVCDPRRAPPGGWLVPNNTHFDTTRANIEATGAAAVDLPSPACWDGAEAEAPFKGDLDLQRLEELLREEGRRVPCVIVTVTNNSGGGQPVSLGNLRAVRALCDKYGGKPLFLDACRFAENAFFIQQREPEFREWRIEDIVREMAKCCHGMTMSAKKDGLSNSGGWLALNDDELAEQCRVTLILTEGYTTYGGMSGRDMDAVAQGLKEVVQQDYLEYRIQSTAYLGDKLSQSGVPVVRPIGGHAVYLDAKAMLPHIPPLEYPGQSLAVELYLEGGIRSCEIGTVMFGLQPDGSEVPARAELVRMAIPRRMYTQSHIDYVVEAVQRVAANTHRLKPYRIVQAPPALRHFTASFAPVSDEFPASR